MVRRKERPARPPPPQGHIDRDKTGDRRRDRQHERDKWEYERHMGKEQRRAGGRDTRERSRERGLSGDRQRERDRQRQKDKDRQRARTRSRERGLDEEPGRSRDQPKEGRASWEEEGDDGERRAGGRQRVQSGPEEVFDELEEQGGGPGSHSQPDEETGTALSPSPGSAEVFVCCDGVAFFYAFGNLRWWVDLTLQSLMKTIISSLLMRTATIPQ